MQLELRWSSSVGRSLGVELGGRHAAGACICTREVPEAGTPPAARVAFKCASASGSGASCSAGFIAWPGVARGYCIGIL